MDSDSERILEIDRHLAKFLGKRMPVLTHSVRFRVSH